MTVTQTHFCAHLTGEQTEAQGGMSCPGLPWVVSCSSVNTGHVGLHGSPCRKTPAGTEGGLPSPIRQPHWISGRSVGPSLISQRSLLSVTCHMAELAEFLRIQGQIRGNWGYGASSLPPPVGVSSPVTAHPSFLAPPPPKGFLSLSVPQHDPRVAGLNVLA